MNQDEAHKTCWVAAINSVDAARPLLPARLPEAADGKLVEVFDHIAEEHSELKEMDRQLSAPSWVVFILPIIAFIIGLGSDVLSSSGKINLIAFPIFVVLAWNFAMYLLLLINATRGPGAEFSATGFKRWLARKYEAIASPEERPSKPGVIPWHEVHRQFVSYWFGQSRGMLIERIKVNLHVAAMLAAVGLIAGMYLRGLAFEYRAGWSSTFLNADSLATLLGVLLSPASWVTGIQLPDADQLQLLAWSTGSKGENAARWIHLYAATCILFIGFPRLVLALASAGKAERLRRSFPLDLNAIGLAVGSGNPLEDSNNPKAKLFSVIPFNRRLNDQDLELVRLFAFGEAEGPVNLDIRDGIEYDEVDEYFSAFKSPKPEPFRYVLVFNLAATPENEVHGDVIRRLQQRATAERLLIYIDGHSFVDRFQGDADFHDRLDSRKQDWANLLKLHEVKPVFLRADG